MHLNFIEAKKIFDRWEFFLHNKELVRLEFVHYDHPKIKKRQKWHGILVDSLDDIAANKLMALFDRNEPKDVIDLYYILTRGKYKLEKLLEFVEQKFGVKFEESAVWSEAMKGLKGVSELKLLLFEKESLEAVNNYFVRQSKQFLNQVLQ